MSDASILFAHLWPCSPDLFHARWYRCAELHQLHTQTTESHNEPTNQTCGILFQWKWWGGNRKKTSSVLLLLVGCSAALGLCLRQVMTGWTERGVKFSQKTPLPPLTDANTPFKSASMKQRNNYHWICCWIVWSHKEEEEEEEVRAGEAPVHLFQGGTPVKPKHSPV